MSCRIKRKPRRHLSVWAVLVVSTVLLAVPAEAVNYTWNGSTSSYFGTASNWTPAGGPPNSNADRAIINSTDTIEFGVAGGLYEPTLWTNQQLILELGIVTFEMRSRAAGQPDLPVTYRLDPGGILPIAAQIGTTAGSKGELNINGGGTVSPTVDAQGILQLGTVANSDGVLKIGTGLLATPSTWNNSGAVLVGSAGKGLVEVNESNFTSVGALLGQSSGAQGIIRVVGLTGGSWVNTGDTNIAQVAGATGEVSIGLVSTWTNTGNVYVGGSSSGSGGTGLLVLDRNSQAITSTQIDINGDLVVYNGGTVDIIDGIMEVGGQVTASGAGTINLAGGTLSVNDELFFALANLNWTSGTFESRNSTSIDVGEALGTSLTLSGTQKLLKVGGTLGIGDIDNGNLQVEAGADVESIVVEIGNANGAAAGGVVTVTGNGSTMLPTGNLNVRGATTAELNVLDGGLVTNLNAFIASDTNSTAQITVSGSNSQWNTSGDANLGGTASFSQGSGTLDVTNVGQVSVAGTTRVWDNFVVTVDGGSLTAPVMDVHGTVNVLGGGSVDLSNGTMTVIGGNVTAATDGTLNADGATVTVQGGGSLDGLVQSDAVTTISLQDSGSLWTTDGPLALGGAGSGLNMVGSLSIATDAQVSVNGLAQLDSPAGLVLNGGTLQAGTINLGSDTFTGNGTLSGDVVSSGGVTANGDLTMGDVASFNGIQITGPINIGTHTVTLLKADFIQIGTATSINGGTLAAPNGVVLPAGQSLLANGIVNSRVVQHSGSTIVATGSLDLGDAAATDGFFSDGVLIVNDYIVTLVDANEVVLGSLTTLGGANSLPGNLNAANGVVLEFGKNLTGYGIFITPNDPFKPLINNGAITGTSLAEPITLTGYVKGVGTLDNVVITGTDAPGFSPATVYRGNVTYAGTLQIELGGAGVGEFDRIIHSGDAVLGGMLDLSLINGFSPTLGDTFQIISASNVSGVFGSISGDDLGVGLMLDVVYSATGVTLEVVGGLAGDLDGDGFVGINDLTIVLANWNQSVPPGNPLADPSGDGFVGIDDLNAVLGNWNAGTPPTAQRLAAIPEPGTFGLAVFGSMLLSARTRRRRAALLGKVAIKM